MKITLMEWAESYFGKSKPSLRTMRRWVSEGKLAPPAEKIGRTLYVTADTVYKGKGKLEALRQLEVSRGKAKG